jgi:hypothetical protein
MAKSKGCKCDICGGDMGSDGPTSCRSGSSRHYQAEDDARLLSDSQAVRDDPVRHKQALAHLDHKAKAAKMAADNETKIKKGLAAAFPEKD